ncbi:MBL fold metallo-hydrolase [Paenibacillus psychroresistens]|uniref:MBL fold metallo-hydrolase n=1 Tax=Paenibacillus psychroresistens TaxID=1778678 RepID=A0A6B8RDQ8_9BACL|nr:MBL fold metallo-hydrolase [Paenibacillus psychroresistens]QGQ94290.1 MBL fold metallo-hydrolase [Paenibacillus psychroresistens]
MINLLDNLRSVAVEPNHLAVCSLGQAGYIYKTSEGQYIVIDPYLTDFCEHRIGLAFKRLMPALIDPAELEALPLTAYLMTHHHEDHLDVELIEALSVVDFPFYAPPQTIGILVELGVAAERCQPLLKSSISYEIAGVSIHSVFADHGDIAPDAVGIIVQSQGKTIYHMGDTCLREAEFQEIANRFEIDLLILPINGKYGNMNEADAVKAISILKPKYAVPCHFWMLPGNSGGDPVVFLEGVKQAVPDTEALLFKMGEIFVV